MEMIVGEETPQAYIETTVVSYLTGKISRDVVVAAHQQITEGVVGLGSRALPSASQFVINEAGAGNPDAAEKRLAALEDVLLLSASDDALQLAEHLLRLGAIPETEPEDAAHIAVAAVHGVEYLVTWNCRHIANATLRSKIERVCRANGFEPPIICTPEEPMEPGR